MSTVRKNFDEREIQVKGRFLKEMGLTESFRRLKDSERGGRSSSSEGFTFGVTVGRLIWLVWRVFREEEQNAMIEK